MTDLQKQFEAAVEQVTNAPEDGDFKPSNEYKLRMYALYRQATSGDATGKRPGMLDPIGRFKFDAWAKMKGMSRETAMQQYIDEVNKVQAQYG